MASDQVLSFRGTTEHLFAAVPSVGFLMGCATCGLWNPFTDAPKRKSPLPSPRTPADSLRTRVRPSRFANRTGAEKARRLCRPEQEYAMPPVPFDGPVPGLSPGGSYGHSRLLSCSFGLWPVYLVPADGSACGIRAIRFQAREELVDGRLRRWRVLRS